jgi:hypothetical protein
VGFSTAVVPAVRTDSTGRSSFWSFSHCKKCQHSVIFLWKFWIVVVISEEGVGGVP